jgi:cobalt-precorrin-5B (C1)-methyltransferase
MLWPMIEKPPGPLRYGWTTGTCAAAAAKAAYSALLTGEFPDPVTVRLPRGETPAFALAVQKLEQGAATAGIVKDAGDDPDVTHGALILVTVRPGEPGSGVRFRAGEGVGMVTKPGLPVPPGEPAINPVPRSMIRNAIAEVAAAHEGIGDVVVTVSIPGGEKLAQRTVNGRLGIVGGLSILGTTGIVVPFSCAAWIHSIYSGIDVARAEGLTHVAGSTGATSEAAVQRLYYLPEVALIDMGDFAGGMLKYLRRHPVPQVTVAGGFAKMVKLGQGLLDLHSRSGEVDRAWLAMKLSEAGGSADLVAKVANANTGAEVMGWATEHNLPLAELVARAAWNTAAQVIGGTEMELEILVFDREGRLLGRAPFSPVHDVPPR